MALRHVTTAQLDTGALSEGTFTLHVSERDPTHW